MGMLASLKRLFAPQPIAELVALQHFLESRAAYLVQKSITEYSQARAGVLFSTLMREPIYIEGYERARWLSYPAAISMVTEMAEGSLRERSGSAPGALDRGLLKLVDAILAQYPSPSGLGEDFWREAADRVTRDLAQAALGPPRVVQKIPMIRSKEIYDVLPVNEHLKRLDFQMFRNTIRFHLTELKVEFEERSEPARLAASLAA